MFRRSGGRQYRPYIGDMPAIPITPPQQKTDPLRRSNALGRLKPQVQKLAKHPPKPRQFITVKSSLKKKHRHRRVSSMVKSYLRYEPRAICAVVASPASNTCWDATRNLAAAPSLEGIGIWDTKIGEQARSDARYTTLKMLEPYVHDLTMHECECVSGEGPFWWEQNGGNVHDNVARLCDTGCGLW